MKIGKQDVTWGAWETRMHAPRRITLPLAEPGLMLRETGDWHTSMIVPPIPAGEAEYDPAEIHAAIQAGEDLTWERISPNLCRIIRIPKPVSPSERS